MDVLPVRDCASPMLMGKFFEPGAVPADTVACTENTVSPAVTSPLVPSSKNACEAEPPIVVRSPLTEIPVLVGLVPGVTVTVRRVGFPAPTVEGFATPVPVGLVAEDPFGVIAKSSTATPSSAPVAFKSVQRMKKVVPLVILKPLIVLLMLVRFAEALPSSAPGEPAVTGLVKSRVLSSVYVPLVRLVASVLSWKSRRSVRPAVPNRHCSPV